MRVHMPLELLGEDTFQAEGNRKHRSPEVRTEVSPGRTVVACVRGDEFGEVMGTGVWPPAGHGGDADAGLEKRTTRVTRGWHVDVDPDVADALSSHWWPLGQRTRRIGGWRQWSVLPAAVHIQPLCGFPRRPDPR